MLCRCTTADVHGTKFRCPAKLDQMSIFLRFVLYDSMLRACDVFCQS